jgi:hypothetical protein
MNYNNRYPAFSFRIDFNLKRKLDKLSVLEKMSTNEFARKIITMYLKNELVKKTEDLQTEKTKLQIEKLKQEVAYMKIKNAFATNFNQPLSRSATVHIKPEIIVETPNSVETIRSPYDASNKRLQCVECGCLFGWQNKDEYYEKAGELQTHLMLKHDRRFNALEKEVIDNLTYEGVST